MALALQKTEDWWVKPWPVWAYRPQITLINLGSIVSDLAVPLQGYYSASKHAVKGFTDALRMELEEEGAPVSVTLVKPAAIDTPFPEHARAGEGSFPPRLEAFLPLIQVNERLVEPFERPERFNERLVDPDESRKRSNERLVEPDEGLERSDEGLVDPLERPERVNEALKRSDGGLKRSDERLVDLFESLERFNKSLVDLNESLERSN